MWSRSKRGNRIISIHAPREGCDGICDWLGVAWQGDFNPRTPRGVRPVLHDVVSVLVLFQSTHPARGATRPCCTSETGRRYFNPRTPRGVRRRMGAHTQSDGRYFNPRTPRGVRPGSASPTPPPSMNFNPRTPRGVRRMYPTIPSSDAFNFNPRTPRGVRPRRASTMCGRS